MSQPAKTRFALDLDDLERQLRQTASAQPRAPASDPLAELARIVGQDDPFKSMLAEKKAAPSPQSIDDLLRADLARQEPSAAPRREPNFGSLLAQGGEPDTRAAAPRPAATPAPAPAAADTQVDPAELLEEFDQMLRDELRGSVSEAAATDAGRPDHVAGEPASRFGAEAAPDAHSDAGGFRDEFEARPMARDLDESDTIARPGERSFAPKPFAMAPAAPRAPQPPMPADTYPEPPEEPQDDLRSLEPRQPRKGLMIAAALLGVAVMGVGVMVGLRGFGGAQKAADGGVPVIRAEAGPNKVAPQNPGGVDIPNQNKEIYERAQPATAANTRVVNREEQPIDVQAVARATPRVIPLAPPETPAPQAAEAPAAPAPAPPANGAAAAAVAPAAPAAAPASVLGEPRRVRTIAVRPDGTIASAPPAPAAPAAVASAPPAEATPAPQRTAAIPAAPRPQPQPPVRPQTAAAPATAPAATAAPAPTPAPVAVAARPEAAAPAGAGFMVQLGAPGSEAEARATFNTLQRRFSEQLGGQSPVIRRADVGNGRTVYRLRVGPFSRDEAVERCEALRTAGGQCFIARN